MWESIVASHVLQPTLAFSPTVRNRFPWGDALNAGSALSVVAGIRKHTARHAAAIRTTSASLGDGNVTRERNLKDAGGEQSDDLQTWRDLLDQVSAPRADDLPL